MQTELQSQIQMAIPHDLYLTNKGHRATSIRTQGLNGIWRAGLILLLCMMSLLWSSSSYAATASASALVVGINDELLQDKEAEAVTLQGRMYVAVVPLAKAMGASTVVQNNDLTISLGAYHMTMPLKTGETIIRNNRTLIPIRDVASGLGYTITNPAPGVYRLVNGTATMTDQQFVAAHAAAIQERQKLVQQSNSNKGSKGTTPTKGKVLYLTFDDGPTKHAYELLSILSKYDAKATFFMLGPQIQQHPDVVRKMMDNGHGLGLHGMTHVEKKFYASPATALKEMKDANAILLKTTGVQTRLIRTPYGSKPYMKDSYRNAMHQGEFRMWDWNVDSLDWKYKKNPEHIVASVLKDVEKISRTGRAPVVLMHDQEPTITILPQLLAELQKRGYQFETLTEEMTPLNFWNDHR
ncbi:polysaccharide deacetylase [Paenibacillus massiliensis]|uniref:polysaccharide deacetylase n=1 Tax=Paenibacillus massiliensis TaxID=225917 RepID=UPI0006863591|nr:polysaccharide deacetylase [Paenibacillus massiliensis]